MGGGKFFIEIAISLQIRELWPKIGYSKPKLWFYCELNWKFTKLIGPSPISIVCDVVKFAVKDYQEALSVLESVPEDSTNKYCMKSLSSSQLIIPTDNLSFSVCLLILPFLSLALLSMIPGVSVC